MGARGCKEYFSLGAAGWNGADPEDSGDPEALARVERSSELLSTREALRRAEALSRSDPSSSLAAFEAGVEILLKYPLHPETLYQWAREVARSTSPLGPLGGMEQIQKTLGILKRLLVTLEKARDRLVMPNYRLVLSAAFRFSAKGMDQTDLFQEGIIGLHKAVFRFDPDREIRFSTYATYWIRQAIRKALVDRSTLIRVPQAAQRKLYATGGRQKSPKRFTPNVFPRLLEARFLKGHEQALKENMSSELLSTREALRRAEGLSRSDPSSSLAAFEEGEEEVA